MKQAVIDIGSNSMRLSVYETTEAGTFTILFKDKIMAGLAGYVEEGALSPEGITRAILGLRSFRGTLRALNIPQVAVFATASLRNIRNTAQAVAEIQRGTGFAIEVLSGEEEARLGYAGAMEELALSEGLFVDIGGASTEVVRFAHGQLVSAVSCPVGSLKLYRDWVKKILPNQQAVESMKKAIRQATRADVLDDLLDPLDYQADGLLTNQPGLCLTIYYADCIPVLLYDPVHRAIAAVHSGWRGTSLGIAPQAVAKMTALYGSDPGDILAAIGPGIGPCCFETHDDVPSAMVQRLGEDILSHCVPLAHGKFSVDLKGIIHWQLTQAGLADGHVDTLSLCTACHPELYWSHRKMGDQRGNHAAMLQLLP